MTDDNASQTETLPTWTRLIDLDFGRTIRLTNSYKPFQHGERIPVDPPGAVAIVRGSRTVEGRRRRASAGEYVVQMEQADQRSHANPRCHAAAAYRRQRSSSRRHPSIVNADPTCAIPIKASSDADSACRTLPSGAPGSLGPVQGAAVHHGPPLSMGDPACCHPAVQRLDAGESAARRVGRGCLNDRAESDRPRGHLGDHVLRKAACAGDPLQLIDRVGPRRRGLACDQRLRSLLIIEALPLQPEPAQDAHLTAGGREQPDGSRGVLDGRPEQRERGSRVDDVEILHKHPECVPVVGSAHELSADRLRNKVRERR